MASFEVDLDLVGHILGERLWDVLQRTLKKYEKLGNHSHERAYGFLGLSERFSEVPREFLFGFVYRTDVPYHQRLNNGL
jgi:hypothetical protein